MRLILSSFIILCSFIYCFGEVIHFNAYNNFQTSNQENIIGNTLVSNNTTTETQYFLYPVNMVDNDYTFEVRFANEHNDEYKSYSVKDINSGKKKKIKNPTWGVVWNFIDKNNHDKLTLQCHNTNNHDILDERFMTIKIVRVINGKETILIEKRADDYVALHSDYNIVSINATSKSTTIKIGNRRFQTIGIIESINNVVNNNIGYFVGAGAKVILERAAIEYNAQIDKQLSTSWTIEKLNTYFSKSNDIYEGYWEYFDRNIDEKRLRLGGRYKIALIKTEIGYDILYIDGAKVNAVNWTLGMIKGRLIGTQFIDNYTLNWYDAMMDVFSVDVYAKFINNSILEISFPIQKSSVRFAKMQ